MIFLKILNMGIAASWLIAAVFLLRLLMKKAPKCLSCLLWALVAVRLICPFSFESAFSFIPDATPIQPSAALQASSSRAGAELLSYNNVYNKVPVSAMPKNILFETTLRLASLAWILGMTVLVCYGIFSYMRLRHKVQEAVPFQDRIWLCDAVHTPFILGFIRPRIYLPSDMDDAQIKYVLAHEKAHLRRLDHWWKLLAFLLLCIYWFHPLVWVAHCLFCRDLELACDERVIKDMDFAGKKAYSSALLACSLPRRKSIVYPLAFGEIGIRERIQTVLQYKKPAFGLILAALTAFIAVGVCFLTNPKTDAYDLKIIIPAGSKHHFHYSDTQISPHKNKITLSCGEGLGDTEVVLKPVYHTRKDAYEPTYMTPGLDVEMYAEKDAWFQVGVSGSHPDKELTVYVHVEGVDVRIADAAFTEKIQYLNRWYDRSDLSEETIAWLEWYNSLTAYEQLAVSYRPYDLSDTDEKPSVVDAQPYDVTDEDEKPSVMETEETATPDSGQQKTELAAAIAAAIMEKNISSSPAFTGNAYCDFVTLETVSANDDNTHHVTCYGWALFEIYDVSAKGIKNIGGSHIPVAVTFALTEHGYQLEEYWEPRDGSYYVDDIRQKFPAHIVENALDSQHYIIPQIQNCYAQALQSGKVHVDTVLENLLDTICADPAFSSSPQDYTNMNYLSYRTLIYYGNATLNNFLNHFCSGNETGLRGKVMAYACEELLQTKGRLPLDAASAETGQQWFDTLIAHAGNLAEPYLSQKNQEKLFSK